MAKTILGIDIGYDNLKLALVNGSTVKKTACVQMPQNLIREGHIASTESLGELVRETMKQNGIRARSGAVVLANENVYIKNVSMPVMNADQLKYNLPFEFRDYITDDISNYLFDYAMLPAAEAAEAEEGAAPTMELMAVGCQRSTIEEGRAVLNKAGLSMDRAAPAMCTYMPLIRAHEAANGGAKEEYCILDLGHRSIRMYMFQSDQHIVTRVLEIGLSVLDDVLAELLNVDVHLARTYLLSNYEDCQSRPECLSAYDNIAVELLRAINFYRFSNPNSSLSNVWLCGGGAAIAPLCDSIAETLQMSVHRAEEFVPGGANIENCGIYVQAIGAAMS